MLKALWMSVIAYIGFTMFAFVIVSGIGMEMRYDDPGTYSFCVPGIPVALLYFVVVTHIEVTKTRK